MPQILSSLPPSPLSEEDLSKAQAWADEDEFTPERHSISPASTDKGKGKQSDDSYDEEEPSDVNGSAEYPPTSDEVAETRRVEENMRRWELAERQRRKAARESTQNVASGSILSGVTRRASLLLSRRKSQRPSGSGLGNHRALKSQDSVDVVPLDDIDQSPTPTYGHSPTQSMLGQSSSHNPFLHPSESEFASPSLSPFADSFQQPPVMKESSAPPQSFSNNQSGQPDLQQPATVSPTTIVPQPQPLGLPLPLTPPPATHGRTPLKPTPAPTLNPSSIEPPHPEPEVRWWHDWLCGCSEGPDRGGENQAGRTNPME
ncbi:hypothetical protein BJ138DRAFT_1004535 [Hygrophoropsis aurantiaca]|uniref:Uncharacterized protein n=1 Tax=Hygrophoropsis aurantiaca TaxID=72124 RepID=A0ACB8AGU4_9AGAM|nr:hypothetical protein BJ138DRAFT_1004535 [Hygrophoropsis aurantiaca]